MEIATLVKVGECAGCEKRRTSCCDFCHHLKELCTLAKLLEGPDVEKARKLFKEAGDQQRVELAEFQKIIAKLAQEQSRTLDQLSKQLAAEGPKVIDAAIKGLHAFKDALKAGKF